MTLLTERYANKIRGQLSCYDRIVIQGTFPGFCYADGMTAFLYANNIRIFDYPGFAQSLRDEIRHNAEKIAEKHSLEIDFIRKKNFRKEHRIEQILKKRGNEPGLVHIFSAMEPCPSYKPWHNKKTHRTYLQSTQGKCLHYYFYFIHEQLGLCYVRVPTWCPFRLQVYFNGHNWLAAQLRKRRINYHLIDNLFVEIDSFAKAQAVADRLNVNMIHKILDTFARQYCPIIYKFNMRYHWSIMQVEYATDIVFNRQTDLQPLYENLTRSAIHTVKPENVATFLSRKLHWNYQDEMGNNFNTRIEGTRIRHTMGPVSIKMYDKLALALRIETTANDVSFFKHYRQVEHRNGTRTLKLAQMKKGVYSLSPLRKLLFAANHRYIKFISAIDDITVGISTLNKISKAVVENNRPYKGFNFFAEDDQRLFEAILGGQFNISGFQNRNLRHKLTNKSSGQVSRILKRLRTHGMIKKIGHTYKYYVTKIGRQIIASGLKLKQLFLIPELTNNLTM
jgi:hypothetical protein